LISDNCQAIEEWLESFFYKQYLKNSQALTRLPSKELNIGGGELMVQRIESRRLVDIFS
jgi:hypothetical protein